MSLITRPPPSIACEKVIAGYSISRSKIRVYAVAFGGRQSGQAELLCGVPVVTEVSDGGERTGRIRPSAAAKPSKTQFVLQNFEQQFPKTLLQEIVLKVLLSFLSH